MKAVNLAEKAAIGEGFSITEIHEAVDGAVSIKTIYAGYSPCDRADSGTLDMEGWKIRKTVITENANDGVTTVTEMWGSGSWNSRTNIEYKYFL